MTVASVLVDDVLQWMNETSDMMPSTSSQQQKVFRVIELLFDNLPKDGIYLRMNRPASISANLREPNGSTLALIPVIAHYSRSYFRAKFTAEQQKEILEAKNYLCREYGRKRKTNYPSTLPRGSGNDNTYFWSYFYPGQDQYKITYWDCKHIGESEIYEFDFTPFATRQNTSVSSVVISNLGSENATISGQSTSSNITSARLTFPTCGSYIVQGRATMASSEISDIVHRIDVVDPEYRDSHLD